MEKKETNFLIALNWSALIIILISLGSMIGIIYYLSVNDGYPIPNNIDVISNINIQDSTKQIELKEYMQIVKNKIYEINNVENIIENKIDEVNTFYKFLATILAIIVGITGFFGFKSLQELKKRTKDNSKEIAETIAKEEIEKEKQNIKEITITTIKEASHKTHLELTREYYEYKIQLETLTKNYEELKGTIDKAQEIENLVYDNQSRIKNLEDYKVASRTQSNIDENEDDNDEKDESNSEFDDKDEFEGK